VRLEQLIGKKAVRTKVLKRMEYQMSGGLSLGGQYIELPDSRWCTQPVEVIAVEDGVVYIEYETFLRGEKKREILDPKYNDDNWAPVNEKLLGAME
jgi:hypothetical protein